MESLRTKELETDMCTNRVRFGPSFYEDPYNSWDLLSPYCDKDYEITIDLGPQKKDALEKLSKEVERECEVIQKRRLNMMFPNVPETFIAEQLTPDHILRSGDRTIVFWQDGTKTIVKRSAVDCPDDYMAFTAALAIKIFGTNSHLKKMLKDKTYIQRKVHGKNKVMKKSDLYAPLEDES